MTAQKPPWSLSSLDLSHKHYALWILKGEVVALDMIASSPMFHYAFILCSFAHNAIDVIDDDVFIFIPVTNVNMSVS